LVTFIPNGDDIFNFDSLLLAPFTFNIGDLKLSDLAKLCVLILIMTKSKFKKSVMTSFQWRNHNCVIKVRHQTNVTKFFIFSPFKISGYVSVEDWSTERKTTTIYDVSAKNLTCKNCV